MGRGWTQSDVNIAPVLCVHCMITLCMYVCLCVVYTVGVNIMFPYRLNKTVVLRRTNAFKTVAIYRFFYCFYGVIRSQFLRVIFHLTPPKYINEKSRTNRLTKMKPAR